MAWTYWDLIHVWFFWRKKDECVLVCVFVDFSWGCFCSSCYWHVFRSSLINGNELFNTFYQMNPPQTNQLRKMGSIALRIWENKCTLLVGSLQKSTGTWWLNLSTISCRIYRYLKRDSASLFFKAPMEFPRDVCPAIMPDVTDRRCCAGDFRGWELVEEKGHNPGGDWHWG